MATNPPSGRPSFLQADIGIGPFHLPMWMWLIGGAAVAAFFIVPRLINRSSAKSPAAADQTSTDASSAAFNSLAQAGIDPLTGVPFSIEGAINPQTGQPNYYNPPVTNPGTQPGGPPPPPPGQGNPVGPGGLQYTPASDTTVIDIATQEYGFQAGDPRLNNAVYDILSHNLKAYPGAKYNTVIPAGHTIFIPPVNPQTGFGTTPQQ